MRKWFKKNFYKIADIAQIIIGVALLILFVITPLVCKVTLAHIVGGAVALMIGVLFVANGFNDLR